MNILQDEVQIEMKLQDTSLSGATSYDEMLNRNHISFFGKISLILATDGSFFQLHTLVNSQCPLCQLSKSVQRIKSFKEIKQMGLEAEVELNFGSS